MFLKDGLNQVGINFTPEIPNGYAYIEITEFLRQGKDNYLSDGTVEIAVKCNSIAETYFNLDTPMYSSCEEVIVIHLDEEKQRTDWFYII